MYRPSPVPPGRVVKNGSKIWPRSSAGMPGPSSGELADHRIAHVAGARGDADAAFLLLAMLPGVADQVPDDLVQVPAVEHDAEVVGNLHDRPRPAACSPPARSRRSASA